MPTDLRRRYFVERPDGAHVADDLRGICQFGHLNLLDTSRSSVVGRVDVIFCRNVLIYFDDFSRRRVIEMFYERLLPGGYLLLGHSESLLNVSTAFELVHLREDLVYRKPVSSTRFWSSGDFFHRDGSIQAGARATLAPSVSSLPAHRGSRCPRRSVKPACRPSLPAKLRGPHQSPLNLQPPEPRAKGRAPRGAKHAGQAPQAGAVPGRSSCWLSARMLPPKAPRGGSR